MNHGWHKRPTTRGGRHVRHTGCEAPSAIIRAEFAGPGGHPDLRPVRRRNHADRLAAGIHCGDDRVLGVGLRALQVDQRQRVPAGSLGTIPARAAWLAERAGPPADALMHTGC